MSYAVSDSVKCLDGVDYNVVKHTKNFEWVLSFEKTIMLLSSAVFETLGVNDEHTLKIAVDGLDRFQENLKMKMDTLVKQMADKPNLNESAKKFTAEWADAAKYQVSLKYHHMGDGPTAQKIRWGFESAIKYIIICATHLADLDDGIEFKKEVSIYVKNIIIQSLIDELQNIKKQIETSINLK